MRRPTPAGLLPWLIGATLLLATVGCSEPPAAMLLWFHPLQATEYPYHTYRVDIVDGIAILDIDGGELQALDVGTGRVLWSRAMDGKDTRRYLVSDGVVYLWEHVETGRSYPDEHSSIGHYSTTVLAMDAETGDVNWQYRPEPDRWSAGFFLSEGVLAVRSDPYFGLDAETGRLLWEAQVHHAYYWGANGIMYGREPFGQPQERGRQQYGVRAVDMKTGEICDYRRTQTLMM